ncbi:MAG: hypothetical protein JO320_10985 [Alphaproteobacteria bacterium]|nr:hypothetical protein [Acetobacteraceae bacterium]MBV9375565.1 hypothetical protein [Alphaproteobacteria bacterium]
MYRSPSLKVLGVGLDHEAEDAWRLSEVILLEGPPKQAFIGGLLENPKATHSDILGVTSLDPLS